MMEVLSGILQATEIISKEYINYLYYHDIIELIEPIIFFGSLSFAAFIVSICINVVEVNRKKLTERPPRPEVVPQSQRRN